MIVRLVIAAVTVANSLADTSLARPGRDLSAEALSAKADAAAAQRSARGSRKNTSIAGRIIHADGAAAEGARIAVYAIREGAPASVVGTATSGHDGTYEVTGLPEGQFAVGATPQRIRGFGGDSRRLTTRPVETLYPGVTDRMKALPITVFDGLATEGIDIWLAPGSQRYTISGKVSWPEKTSVEHIVIEFGGPGDVHRGVWYVSDPGGLFTIEGASPGTYLLLARGETAQGPLVGVVSTNVSDDVHDVRLPLRTPGRIEGRILVDGSGGPELSGLRVVPAQALFAPSPLYPVEEAAVDADGRFTLSQLAGEYTLRVTGLPSGWRVRRVARAGTPLIDGRLSVPPGERATGVEILLGR